MSENVADKQHFPVEVDRCDQSIFVAANVKHVKVADLVCRIERALQFGQIVEITRLNNLAPRLKRRRTFGTNRRKVEQRFV